MSRAAAHQQSRRNIAVIVVHGVGDQKPLESAHAVSDLLQDLDIDDDVQRASTPPLPCTAPQSEKPRYSPFTRRDLRINVRPVVTSDGETPAVRDMRGPFHAAVDKLYARKRSGASLEQDRIADDIATAFMRGQLRCYGGDSPEDTYETARFEGTRNGAGQDDRTVHVYELYWADLSRLKAKLFSIFTELYQLLFHLSSLGTHAVDAEASRHLVPSWQRFRKTQASAAMVLAVPIPVLNLFLLAITGIVAATVALYRVPAQWRTVLVISVWTAVLAAAAGALCWRARRLSSVAWMTPIVAWIAVVAVVAVRRPAIDLCLVHAAAQIVLIVAAGFLVDLTLRAYDDRRPGVRAQGWVLGGITIVAGAVTALLHNVRPGEVFSRIVIAWVRLFEVAYGALVTAWSLFALLSIAAFFAGEIAVWSVADRRQRNIARRSRWTARLMLSLPAAAFLSLTLAGWALISFAVKPLIGDLPYQAVLFRAADHGGTMGSLGYGLLGNAGGIVLPVVLVAAAIAALPAVWGLVPVVWAEVRPPKLYQAQNPLYSERLGRWLTSTFGGLTVSGALLIAAMTFVVPALTVAAGTTTRTITHLQLVRGLGAISGFLFAWLFTIRGDLKKLALGFAPVLDIMLDVDNWLREHPLSRNPKARICGRYVSLLRYLCQWADPIDPGHGYDAIVILAHSQGTVISADLLRFLAIDRDPQLSRLEGHDAIPIALFTMGCPLRQLYGSRFPRLYEWATHDDDAAMTAWTADDLAVPPRTSVAPDPAALRVRPWVNTYRSGDYIGRYLWRTDACGYVWSPDLLGASPSNSVDDAGRIEWCIGAGAHTHYWDSTARPVAWALDALIARV